MAHDRKGAGEAIMISYDRMIHTCIIRMVSADKISSFSPQNEHDCHEEDDDHQDTCDRHNEPDLSSEFFEGTERIRRNQITREGQGRKGVFSFSGSSIVCRSQKESVPFGRNQICDN